MKNTKRCINASRIGRGKNTGLSIAKKRRKSATRKLHDIILADKMVVVGPGAADFIIENMRGNFLVDRKAHV